MELANLLMEAAVDLLLVAPILIPGLARAERQFPALLMLLIPVVAVALVQSLVRVVLQLVARLVKPIPTLLV